MLRSTVSQPVRLGIMHPSGAHHLYYYQKVAGLCGWPSLIRGRVRSLQFLLSFTSAAILGSETNKANDHMLLSEICYFPNLVGQVPTFISPKNPQALGGSEPFSEMKLKLCCDRWAFVQSVSVSDTHQGAMTRFLSLQESCGFLLWCALSAARSHQRSHPLYFSLRAVD
jgi:hypothetical protein